VRGGGGWGPAARRMAARYRLTPDTENVLRITKEIV